MIPPRRKIVPARKPADVEFIVNCTRCGHGRTFKGVAGVDYNNICNRTAILNAVGWQNMPRVLCRSCCCPMDGDEKIEWSRLLSQYESSGFDTGALQFVDSFKADMRTKYGWQVDKFFATPEQ